jgi:elongation factor P
VKIRFFKGSPFSVEAPNFVELLITHSEPGVTRRHRDGHD